MRVDLRGLGRAVVNVGFEACRPFSCKWAGCVTLMFLALGMPGLLRANDNTCYSKSAGTNDSLYRAVPYEYYPELAVAVPKLLNANNLSFARCFKLSRGRTGIIPNHLLVGVRVSASGEPLQTLILKTDATDEMLLSCIGRRFCEMSFPPSSNGEDRVISVGFGR